MNEDIKRIREGLINTRDKFFSNELLSMTQEAVYLNSQEKFYIWNKIKDDLNLNPVLKP